MNKKNKSLAAISVAISMLFIATGVCAQGAPVNTTTVTTITPTSNKASGNTSTVTLTTSSPVTASANQSKVVTVQTNTMNNNTGSTGTNTNNITNTTTNTTNPSANPAATSSSTTSAMIANLKTPEITLKQMGEVKSRIEQLKLMQELKEAEYKFNQPVEDKDKKRLEEKNSPNISSMGNITAGSFNPVIKGNSGSNAAERRAVNTPEVILMDKPPQLVTVYSVVGFDGDYSAKVSLDGKSIYTVKKNDILPDGQVVIDITRFYIVVAERNAIGRKLAEPQRVYVTGRPTQAVSPTDSATAISTRGIAAPTNFIGTTPSGIIAPGQMPRSTTTVGAGLR